MSRIFISHSSTDNAKAMAFRDWLTEQGWDDVFLDLDPERGLKAGDQWQGALKRASTVCELVIFLISPAWARSQWCLAEFLLAKQLNKRIFGAIVESTENDLLPIELTSEWQLVDLVEGQEGFRTEVAPPPGAERVSVAFAADGLDRLRIGLLEAGLDASYFAWPPEHDPDRPPYRGLKPLEAEDAGIFFGREAPVVEALDRLRGVSEAAPPRMMVILGASGAGKSSFMRAGLIPRLERDQRRYRVLPIVRPGQAALSGDDGLVRCLEQALEDAGGRQTRAALRRAVDDGGAAVADLLRPLAATADSDSAGPTLILPIDQGEELFFADGGDEAGAFLALLRDLLNRNDPPMAALVTIRSDSYEPLQTADALAGVPLQTFSLPPMPKGAYGQVISGPAARLQATPRPLVIEEPLVDALLSDIEADGAKDALPLLAFALERLYRDYGGDGDLKLAEYEDMGRIGGAIAAAVEQALRAADADPAIPRDRPARLALLKRGLIPWLAGIDPETGAPRRRVARLSEIPPESRPLIDLLVEQRLLSTDLSEETGEVTIEPAHEALLRQWPLLEGWLDEDFEDLSTAEGVRRAARDWLANDRDEEWLTHTGGRLDVAERVAAREDFADLFDPGERAYLAAARDAETARKAEAAERERREREQALQAARDREQAARTVARRTRIGLAASLVLAVAAVAFGWQALEQQERADAATREAVAQATDARRQSALYSVFAAREMLDQGRNDQALLLLLDSSDVFNDADAPDTLSVALHEAIGRASGSRDLPMPSGANVFQFGNRFLAISAVASRYMLFDGVKHLEGTVQLDAQPIAVVEHHADEAVTLLLADGVLARLLLSTGQVERLRQLTPFDEVDGVTQACCRDVLRRGKAFFDPTSELMHIVDAPDYHVAVPSLGKIFPVADRLEWGGGAVGRVCAPDSLDDPAPWRLPDYLGDVTSSLIIGCRKANGFVVVRWQDGGSAGTFTYSEPRFPGDLQAILDRSGQDIAFADIADVDAAATGRSVLIARASGNRVEVLLRSPARAGEVMSFTLPQDVTMARFLLREDGRPHAVAAFMADAGLIRVVPLEAPDWPPLGDGAPGYSANYAYPIPKARRFCWPTGNDELEGGGATAEQIGLRPLADGLGLRAWSRGEGYDAVHGLRVMLEDDGGQWIEAARLGGRDSGACVEISPDGERLLVNVDGVMSFHDVAVFKSTGVWEASKRAALTLSGIEEARFFGDGASIVLADGSHNVRRFRVSGDDDGWERAILYRGNHPIIELDTDSAGRRLILTEAIGKATIRGRIWSAETGEDWYVSRAEYKWFRPTFLDDRRIALYFGDTGHVFEFPTLSELRQAASGALSRHCAPATAGAPRSSPCWAER